MDIKYHLIRLAKSKPPTERLLFKFGVNKTTKGDFYLTKESAKEIINNWKDYGNNLNIDYNHNQLANVIDPEAGASAGTFQLEVRPSGLWAVDIIWTDRASKMIESREYIYTSPAFITEDRNGQEVIIDVLNFALTNIPATKNMDMLIAASKYEKTKKENMTEMSENTENTEIKEVALGKELADMPTDMPSEPIKDAPMDSPDPEDIEHMKEYVKELEAKLAEKEALVLELEAKLAELEGQGTEAAHQTERLSKQVQDLTQKIDTKEKEDLINSAIVAGRILPAQKALYLSLGKDSLVKEIEKLPKQVLLEKTQETVLNDSKKSEVQKLSAYITSKLNK